MLGTLSLSTPSYFSLCKDAASTLLGFNIFVYHVNLYFASVYFFVVVIIVRPSHTPRGVHKISALLASVHRSVGRRGYVCSNPTLRLVDLHIAFAPFLARRLSQQSATQNYATGTTDGNGNKITQHISGGKSTPCTEPTNHSTCTAAIQAPASSQVNCHPAPRRPLPAPVCSQLTALLSALVLSSLPIELVICLPLGERYGTRI